MPTFDPLVAPEGAGWTVSVPTQGGIQRYICGTERQAHDFAEVFRQVAPEPSTRRMVRREPPPPVTLFRRAHQKIVDAFAVARTPWRARVPTGKAAW